MTGEIHTVNKHGVAETDSIRSILDIVVPILVICLPLLLSTIAYLAGWLGSFKQDENRVRNTPRAD